MNVAELAAKVGVPLSGRSVSGSYMWDGKTLGMFYQDWDESDEARRPRLLPERKPIESHAICHDLAHWMVAEPWARDLPEWGLAPISVEYGANAGYHLHQDARVMDGLFSQSEQDKQEALAWLLGRHYCLMCGTDYPDSWKQSWLRSYDRPVLLRWGQNWVDQMEIEDRRWCAAELIRRGLMTEAEVERAKGF